MNRSIVSHVTENRNWQDLKGEYDRHIQHMDLMENELKGVKEVMVLFFSLFKGKDNDQNVQEVFTNDQINQARTNAQNKVNQQMDYLKQN